MIYNLSDIFGEIAFYGKNVIFRVERQNLYTLFNIKQQQQQQKTDDKTSMWTCMESE